MFLIFLSWNFNVEKKTDEVENFDKLKNVQKIEVVEKKDKFDNIKKAFTEEEV